MPMTPRPVLTVNGEQYAPTREDVLAAMRGVPARPIPPGGYWVQVGRRRYPLREVVSRTLGVRSGLLKTTHALAFARYLGLTWGQEEGAYQVGSHDPFGRA